MSDKVTLTELQLIIRDSLYLSLPDYYWVIAEISELKVNNSGHCYLELIEKNADEKNVRSKIKAIIWNNRYRFLKTFFESITRETFKEGLKILVKARIEYHELYGLSLIINDIDPAFTQGEMAMRRQLIIQRLEQEGVFSMNRELEFPLVPQRIAIISSTGAAGYADFMNHLTDNSSGYKFYTRLYETILQGTETEQSVIQALDKIAAGPQNFDIVIIIRGGGSQSDLSWFDNYNIAYHITQFPLPVVTGIGHDKDVSVTDMVANRSLKTPTAVADMIITCTSEAENNIIGMGNEIAAASRKIIELNKTRIETSGIRLMPLARIMISELKEKVSSQIIEIINVGKELIIRAGVIPANQKSRLISGSKSLSSGKKLTLIAYGHNLFDSARNEININGLKLKSLEGKSSLLDPGNILKRGFSITSMKGKIIKGMEEANEGDIIDTLLYNGKLKSVVTQKTEITDSATE